MFEISLRITIRFKIEREKKQMERKNVWKTYSEEQLKAADVFGKEYMYFLDHGKTERE